MTSAVKLYERTEALSIIDNLLIETDGELTPEIEALLNEAELAFSVKVTSVAAKITEFEATAAAVETEAKRLAQRAKSFASKAESLRTYLRIQMQLAGRPKIEDSRFTIALRDNPPRVVALLCDPSTVTLSDTMPAEELLSCITHTDEVVTPARDDWDKKALLALHKTNPDLVASVAQIERGVRIDIR